MLNIEWALEYVAGYGSEEMNGLPARIQRYRATLGSSTLGESEHWLTLQLIPNPAWDNDILISLANGYDASSVRNNNSLARIFMREIDDDRLDGASPFELFVLTPNQNESLSRFGSIIHAGDVIGKSEMQTIGYVHYEPNLFEYHISDTDIYDRTNEILNAICGHSYEVTLWRKNIGSEDPSDRYCFDVTATTINIFQEECLNKMVGDTKYEHAFRCVFNLLENIAEPNCLNYSPSL